MGGKGRRRGEEEGGGRQKHWRASELRAAGGTFGRSPAEAAARGVQMCADVTQRAINDASVENEPL